MRRFLLLAGLMVAGCGDAGSETMLMGDSGPVVADAGPVRPTPYCFPAGDERFTHACDDSILVHPVCGEGELTYDNGPTMPGWAGDGVVSSKCDSTGTPRCYVSGDNGDPTDVTTEETPRCLIESDR